LRAAESQQEVLLQKEVREDDKKENSTCSEFKEDFFALGQLCKIFGV